MEGKRKLITIIGCALVLAAAAHAGTFVSSPWTSDADSGISAGKLYTHTGKFWAPADAQPFYAGNGVWFEGDRDLTGVDWRMSNIPNVFAGDHGTNVTGAGGNLLTHFVYGDDPAGIMHPVLQLENLTPGTKYTLTLYAKGWENAGRVINITPSDDPNNAVTIDQDLYGGGNGLLLKYTYTAPASGTMSLTFAELSTNMSWHHYAFSNEEVLPVYVDPKPVPGAFTDLTVTLDFTAIPDEGVDTSNLVYDLYWWSDPNVVNRVADLTAGTYTLSLLESTTYYWQVDIFDDGELLYSTDPNETGKAWMFLTKTLAPAEKALQYKMDETSGTTVGESIGGYHAAAINFDDPNEGGTAWVEGIAGNCLSFDGADSYVDLGNTAPLPFGAGKGFSISGYFKTMDAEGPLVTFRNAADGGPIVALTVGYDGADTIPTRLRFIAREFDGGSLFRLTGPAVNDGEWNHFALTRDIDGTITLYVNGRSCGSLNDMRVGYNVDLRAIGSEIRWINDSHGAAGQRYLNGLIDEVVVWEGALKQSQIDAMVDLIPYRLNPTPAMDAKANLDVVLRWTAPIDRVSVDTYNVYLGTTLDMNMSTDGATGLTTAEFVPTEPLDYDTRYFWQVELVRANEVVYTSPIWTFRTIAATVGAFSFHPWTGDADSSISSSKTYTHAVNFSATGTDGELIYAGNGVYFENDVKANGVNDSSGVNWSLTGAPSVFWVDHAPPITGNSLTLARRFYFGEQAGVLPRLTFTGLTLGTKYITTLYTTSFGGAGDRYVRITPSDNPDSPTRIDQNAPGGSNGRLIKYTYTATSTEMSFVFDAEIKGNSWHHYAFSNEIALPFELTPTPAPLATVDMDAVLSWLPVPLEGAWGATYNLTVATDPELTAIVAQQMALPGTSFALTDLDPQTRYYWKVDGLLEGEIVYNGPVWTFYTKSSTPAQLLVAWKMDEGSGGVAHEVTGTGLDGTLTNFADPNAAWVPGIDGTAISLDGVDDYVSLADTTPLTAAQGSAFSMSGYFRTNDSQGPIFAMRNPGILAVYVGFDGADNVPGHFRFISASGGLRRITGPRVDDGLWHHFAVTRSTFGKVELYIDGISAGTTNDMAGQYVNAWSAFGTDRAWLSDWLTQALHPHDWYRLEGLIDEITIWQDELQPDQIAAMVAMLPVVGDLNEDGQVDFEDLAMMAEGWLTDDPAADVNRSGAVDMVDFGLLSERWN
ncbi:MAG: hypothetical protein IH624_12575 [Phycisphaerae bacterium]|nr:hypothetical protein [Phycisphaerae bacterium]